MRKIGVIGIGQLGGALADCLARQGHLAAVHDTRPEAANGLEGAPPMAASPADLARRADVVIIAVLTAQQVVDVLSGPDGVLAAARPGLDVILISTIALPELDRVRALTEAAGVGLVDCGVTGGPVAARDKGLVCLVGADEAAYARVEPVLQSMGKLVVHMGGPGKGMAGKIARNAIFIGTLRAAYEGAVLAQAAGVDLAKLDEVIAESTAVLGSPLALVTRPGDPRNDPAERALRQASLALVSKDLEAALDLAGLLGVSLPTAELALREAPLLMGLGDRPGPSRRPG